MVTVATSRCYLRYLWGIVSLIYLSLYGCRSSVTPPPSPDQILARAVSRMQSLSSFRFLIERQGDPAFLDAEGTLSFRRAEGFFISPDRAWAVVRVITPGLVVEIQAISIGEDYWETDLLTNEWHYLPAGQGFNPRILFDPQNGFSPILKEDLSELQFKGLESLENLPGQSFYALEGRLTGGRIYQLSYGLIGPESVKAQLWIDPQTFDLARALLFEPSVEGEGTTWLVDFWDYNQELSISPPLGIAPSP